MGAQSSHELAGLAHAAAQAVADLDRRIAEQEQLVARAGAEARASHDRYRTAPQVEQCP